ncbi:sulfur carrier protein ThiS [Hyphomicrobium sp.]|uniref:sulfur carrier protein ThiS n=1 Tax=Hyphomicrobium sp. TaxID=82 RepID=UPI002E345908|nr:sulfur carrier protein ThiS [Hyphomicrobium sp.]HEX2842948.1 sulfur carrier protein ThiS [Hyphomicrobium sp.]
MTTSTTSLLQIAVNGAALATAAETLADLVVEQGFGGTKVATAVNGEFVAERLRASTKLMSADRIEILSVRQGG